MDDIKKLVNTKLVFTSRGLETEVGKEQFKKTVEGKPLDNEVIFLFIKPYDDYEEIIVNACVDIGFSRKNIFVNTFTGDDGEEIKPSFVYITAGNTFDIMYEIRHAGLFDKIKKACETATYWGASAGAAIAATDIYYVAGIDVDKGKLKEEKNENEYEGLALVDGAIVPHCSRKKIKTFKKNLGDEAQRYNGFDSVGEDAPLVL